MGAPVWRRASAADVTRKQVRVNGKLVKVIDIHGHMVVPKAAEVLAGTSLKGRFPPN
jgi:hypothetical protein